MKQIVLVGDIFNFNESLVFVLRLAGFEVRQVRNVEEAINLDEIHRCIKGGFDMLVLKNSDFIEMWPRYSELLIELLQKTKVLRIVNIDVTNEDNADLDYLNPSGRISVCNATDIATEIKRFFDRY